MAATGTKYKCLIILKRPDAWHIALFAVFYRFASKKELCHLQYVS